MISEMVLCNLVSSINHSINLVIKSLPGCPATWKTWKTWNTQGIFLPVYENFLNGLLFELLPDNNRKIICKIILVMILTAVYKKPQGILLKLTLGNLEISGNFVLEIGWTPCLN